MPTSEIYQKNREYYTEYNKREDVRRKWELFCKEYPERRLQSKEKTQQKLRVKVFTHYGHGKLACILCGFSDMRALTIDHINNNGAEERRKTTQHAGIVFYRWLQKSKFPEGYQTLCMNCQFIKNRERRK